MEQIRSYTGLKAKACSEACSVLRGMIKKRMLEIIGDDAKFGESLNTVVLVDEPLFMCAERNQAGFRGRATCGQQVVVVGFSELDLTTWEGTG